MYRDFPTMNRVFVNLPNIPSTEFPHHPLKHTCLREYFSYIYRGMT